MHPSPPTQGFTHSAFTFSFESLLTKSPVLEYDVPPGALITFLQKGLAYIGLEEHVDEDGTERPCDEDLSLVTPHMCQAKKRKGTKNRRNSKSKPSQQQPLQSPSSGSSTMSPTISTRTALGDGGGTTNFNLPPKEEVAQNQESRQQNGSQPMVVEEHRPMTPPVVGTNVDSKAVALLTSHCGEVRLPHDL